MKPFLLHAANRNIKYEEDEIRNAFYAIKDKVLSKWGNVIGYDIQHIKGKRCNSCDGHGRHAKYGHNGKIYDYADCYHCWGGWYKLPIWVALHRIQYGNFVFHKPLKRHECVGNPFSEEEMGWKVSESPVIEGYIEHKDHWFGDYAMLILFWFYNRPIFDIVFKKKWYWKKVAIRNWFKRKLTWTGWIIQKPRVYARQYWDNDFTEESDLPF